MSYVYVFKEMMHAPIIALSFFILNFYILYTYLKESLVQQSRNEDVNFYVLSQNTNKKPVVVFLAAFLSVFAFHVGWEKTYPNVSQC